MGPAEDANDLLRQRGRGAVRRSFDAAGLADNTPSGPRQDKLVPTRWTPPDPATIPLRPWLYGRLLMRGTLTVTIAPGGVGKSILAITEAVAMAARRSLLEMTLPAGDLRVWYVNCEDPNSIRNPELSRRATAVCLHHGVRAEDLEGRLFLDSAVPSPVLLGGISETRAGFTIDEAEIARIESELLGNRIDVLILDPFVSIHSLNENDNVMIDRLAKRLVKLADDTGSAVHLIHHTRKANGTESDAESARGASALNAAARIVRVLNPMTKSEADQAGIRPEDRRRFFRTSIDKQNLAPPETDRNWHELVSVDLGNGTLPFRLDSDFVGVPQKWSWPDQHVEISPQTIRLIQDVLHEKDCAAHPTASDWAGWKIAEVMGISMIPQGRKAPEGSAPVQRVQEGLIREGWLMLREVPYPRRGGSRKVVGVGRWVEEGS